MAPEEIVTLTGDNPRHFEVELMIVHPSVDPAEITTALGLPGRSWKVGAPRKTPKGTPLDGVYPDTRWKYRLRYQRSDQWFSKEFVGFLDGLIPHKGYLAELSATGGTISINLVFLGDGYFGDEVSKAVLTRLAELSINLGIECYTIPDAPLMDFAESDV